MSMVKLSMDSPSKGSIRNGKLSTAVALSLPRYLLRIACKNVLLGMVARGLLLLLCMRYGTKL